MNIAVVVARPSKNTQNKLCQAFSLSSSIKAFLSYRHRVNTSQYDTTPVLKPDAGTQNLESNERHHHNALTLLNRTNPV